MSLLKKASIITTPTAYAEDYLYSIKPAYALGSSLTSSPVNLSNDFNANGSSSITDADTFTSTGGSLDGITSKTSVYTLTVGRRFQIEIQGNTTSSGFTLGAGNGNGDEYGSGFGVHTFVSLHAQLWIRQRTSGTTNITKLSIQEVTDADFQFDRNSTGTRLNEDYLIEDVPYNLVLQSNQFDTTWTLFQGGTVTGGQPDKDFGNNAWKLNAVSTQTFSGIHQARTFTGVTTASIFAKAGTLSHLGIVNLGGSGFAVWFNLSNGTIGTKDASVSNANMQNLGDGWYRCSFTQDVSAAGFFQLKPSDGELTPSTTSGFIYIQDAQLVKGDQPKDYLQTTDRLDIPRIDYTNGEPSILLEPSRTNSYTHNNNFTDSSWLKKDTSFGSTDVVSPDGLVNAKKLVCSDTTNQTHYFEKTTYTGVRHTTYTYSIFVKSAGSDFVQIATSTGFESKYQNFNLAQGTLATGDLGTYSANIVSYPNDWYRISITATASVSDNSRFILVPILTDAGRNPSFAGSTSKGVYIYGIQHEIGSYATSLIHTSGSAVTRSADAANNAGNSDLINSTEGVLYAEMKALADDATNRRISISDGTTANRMYISYKNFTNQIRAEVISSSSSVFDATYSANDITIFSKIALKYKLNDFSLYIDGVEVANDTSGAVPTGLKELAFDDGAGNNDFYGNVKSLMVFKEALTDLELEKLTGYNNHELYMNYYNRLSYLGLVEEYNVESDINNYIL